ncbi:Uncharacterized protein DBV15_01706 [Temnothorax longispinosus]|uniref:Uncharacterized protein n=1 Tax=Temnothorax longispinosus TaxID=300112 RepID=A0A4S2L1Z8_9HYME|nr:Uncharacterized protein DBV15_01706 [Temnothorax longispinosus]
MRAVLCLLVAVTFVMIQEANSTPGFFEDLLYHCPLLSYLFPNCCCDYDRSCCPTTTTTTTTTTPSSTTNGG